MVTPLAQGIANQFLTSPDDILALSAFESGWLNDHNQALHNPFGLTDKGGPNLNFSSYQEAAIYWSANDGKYVQGITDISTFANALQPHYNVVNPNWTGTLNKVYQSVLNWEPICGQ